jgi:hypothetical protein
MAPLASLARAARIALLLALASAHVGCGGGGGCGFIDECESSMSFRLWELRTLLSEAGGAPLVLSACVDDVCGETTVKTKSGCLESRGALRSCEVWGPDDQGIDEGLTLALNLRLGGSSRSWQGTHVATLTVRSEGGEVLVDERREIELSAQPSALEGCGGGSCWVGPTFAVERR